MIYHIDNKKWVGHSFQGYKTYVFYYFSLVVLALDTLS